MSDDEGTQKQSFNIRDITTRSVTIFPQNAQVVRVLDDVSLKPGQNYIEIVGLSPTVDKGSIKVDGHGKASISGMTVESIRNPENYYDVYDSDADDDLDEPDEPPEPEKPRKLLDLEAGYHGHLAELNLLEQEINIARESKKSLLFLVQKVEKGNINIQEMTSRVEAYNSTAVQYEKQIQVAQEKRRRLTKKTQDLHNAYQAASREHERNIADEKKETKRTRAKWERLRKARRLAREERRLERSKFWPKKVFKVTVVLESLSDAAKLDLQSSTRQESKQPATDSDSEESEDEQVSLSIYYVTAEASWEPAYDLTVKSSTQDGTLVYRAEVSNKTSETWKDARITLSTSQTAFHGLRDPLPELTPWQVQLLKGRGGADAALTSRQEQLAKLFRRQQQARSATNRDSLFGVPEDLQEIEAESSDDDEEAIDYSDDNMASRASAKPAPPQQMLSRSFAAAPPPPAPSGALFGSFGGGVRREADEGASADKEMKRKKAPLFEPLKVADVSWAESGLTAAWDLSGQRTIEPSSTQDRHRISVMELSKLEFKHVCVPKLRPDAFLTMRLRNPSTQTMLPGEAGITLDGAFLGSTPLKRIAPGDAITVSLGVDPGIVVEYPPPIAKRNLKTGLINKDDSTSFQRCVVLRHTKSVGSGTPRPTDITVHDQIPMPIDERIRLELLKPRGLRAVGDAVRAGEAVKDDDAPSGRANNRDSVSTDVSRASSVRDEAWGKATVSLEKGGALEWKVKLNPGQKVALPLEYDLKFPASETLVSAGPEGPSSSLFGQTSQSGQTSLFGQNN